MLEISPLCIVVIGHNAHLRERLTALPVTETEAVLYGEEHALQADVVLFDGAPSGEFKLSDFIRSAERILYALPGALETAAASDFFTGAWPADCSVALLELWYRQVLRSAKFQRQKERTEKYLFTLIDSMPDLVWFKDLRGSHLLVNEAFGRAVGKTKEQCQGRGHYYIWDLEPEDYAAGEYVCMETEEEVIKRGETCLFDEKVLSQNGLRQFKTYKSPLFDRWGELFGTVGVAKDVTDLQNTSRELSLVLSSIPLATAVADDAGELVFINDKFCEYFSVNREQAQSMSYSQFCKDLLHLSPEALECRDMTEITVGRGETLRRLQVQQQTLKDIFGNHFGNFFLGLDVTYEHKLKEEILHSASTDFLTDLANRRQFYSTLQGMPADTPVSLISFDLDNFKQVNDSFGHQMGDQVLITTARQLEEAFKEQLITRMGGDEFIVTFFGHQDTGKLMHQVESFIEHLHRVFWEEMGFDFLSVSAGIAQGTAEMPGFDELFRYVDEALYMAKEKGKGRCVFL